MLICWPRPRTSTKKWWPTMRLIILARTVGLFLPHLQRAMQLSQRRAQANLARRAALDAAERIDVGVIVADRDGVVLYANSRAELTLRQADALSVKTGRLAAINRSASERLVMFVRGASESAAGREGSSGGAIAINREGRLPLTVSVAVPGRPRRPRSPAARRDPVHSRPREPSTRHNRAPGIIRSDPGGSFGRTQTRRRPIHQRYRDRACDQP
jgi:PAS domain-containing protein